MVLGMSHLQHGQHDWIVNMLWLPVCLFALRQGDQNQFTPIGKNIIRSTMKAVYRPILIREITQEKKAVLYTASPASAELSAGLGAARPVLRAVPGTNVTHQA